MADAKRKTEENGSRPPGRFLRPGYITTAGSDEIRDCAERSLREHEEEMDEDDRVGITSVPVRPRMTTDRGRPLQIHPVGG